MNPSMKQTDSENKLVAPKGEGREGGIHPEFGISRPTAIYRISKQYDPAV